MLHQVVMGGMIEYLIQALRCTTSRLVIMWTDNNYVTTDDANSKSWRHLVTEREEI